MRGIGKSKLQLFKFHNFKLQDIEVQKEACKQIIAQKDELIKSFMEQLKSKDEDYVKALKK